MVHNSGEEHIAYVIEGAHMLCIHSRFNLNLAYWDVALGADVIDNHLNL